MGFQVFTADQLVALADHADEELRRFRAFAATIDAAAIRVIAAKVPDERKRCPFCGRTAFHLSDSLHFRRSVGPRLIALGDSLGIDFDVPWQLIHAKCPDISHFHSEYVVSLDRLQDLGEVVGEDNRREDDYHGWLEHMWGKDNWQTKDLVEGLAVAHAVSTTCSVRGWLSPTAKRRERDRLSPKLRYAVLEASGFKCVACGAKPAEKGLHVDHIRPISRGGRTVRENLQALCVDCNHGKGTRVSVVK